MGHGRRWGVGWFVRSDGGYTTVAIAVALLVSLSLIFGMAAAQWSLARSADVQEVADAAALAGESCVAAYARVVQAVDACVLTLGIAGIVVCGAGLVVAGIPALQAKSVAILRLGHQILKARDDFSRSAEQGLARYEEVLPALVMASSASCVAANGSGGIRYVGMAVPYPQTSRAGRTDLPDGPDDSELQQRAEQLAEASARKQRAHERAERAKERAWRADNVEDPRCLWSRAATLAGLSGTLNPRYDHPSTWEFEFARLRAHNYYVTRASREAPANGGTEELQRSAARARFFDYAVEALGRMSCTDEEDQVDMDLEVLPHTTRTVMETRLYTDVVWPCSHEEEGRTLHCSLACPGVRGPSSGAASLADIDAGGVLRCETCRMDARAMGNVADASTNIDNGFEHYWRIVVESSDDYERARKDEIEAEREMRELAEEGADAFDHAIEVLSEERPDICPAGAWGCVAVVSRPSATVVPSELTAAFLSSAQLPPGAAASAATLVVDDAASQGDELSSAFGRLQVTGSSDALDLVGNVTRLWGGLLQGLGSSSGLGVAPSAYLQDIEGTSGERVATWLRRRLADAVSGLGLGPIDLRVRKPALVNTQTVLDHAGTTTPQELRTMLGTLPSSPTKLASVLRDRVASRLGTSVFTVAELPIPGRTGMRVPFAIDLSQMGVS